LWEGDRKRSHEARSKSNEKAKKERTRPEGRIFVCAALSSHHCFIASLLYSLHAVEQVAHLALFGL
jgi:hypothetical protein